MENETNSQSTTTISNNPLISISSFLLKPLLENITIGALRQVDCLSSYESLFNILLQMTSTESFAINFTSDADKEYFLNAFSSEAIKSILRQRYIIGENGDEIGLHIISEYLNLFIKYITDTNSGVHKLIEIIKEIFDGDHNYYKGDNMMYYMKKITKEAIDTKRSSHELFNNDLIDRSDFIKSLEVGKEIDVFITITTRINYSYNQQTAWVRGIIKSLSSSRITVIVPSMKEYVDIPIVSLDYCECGTFTSDYKWRQSLQPNDVIKCYDEYKKQFRDATIIERREETINNMLNVTYRIGYRKYCDAIPNWKPSKNTRTFTDSNGRIFIGDNEKMDQMISFFSKYIQKQDFTTLLDDYYFYDILIPFNGTSSFPNYVIGRRKIFQYFYAAMTLRFCLLNGFEKLMEFLLMDKGSNCDYANDLFILLCNIMLQTRFYLHLDYIKQLSTKVKELFPKYLCNEKFLKGLRKEYIEFLFYTVNFYVVKGSSQNEEGEIFVGKILIKSSFELLKTDILDKRLIGLKKITDLLQSSEGDIHKALLNEIDKNDVLSIIFGSNSHNQIIVKSKELVEVITKKGLLSNDHIKAIWLGTKNGDLQSKLSIINLLKEVCDYMPKERQQFLLTLLFSDDYKSVSIDEIELIRLNDKGSESSFDYLLNLLFFTAIDEEEKIEKIINTLFIIMMLIAGEKKELFFTKMYLKCSKNLKENLNVHVTLIMLSRMIQDNLFTKKVEYEEMIQLFIDSCNEYKKQNVLSSNSVINHNNNDIKQKLSYALLLYRHNPDAFSNMIQYMFEFLVITAIAPVQFYEWALSIISDKNKETKREQSINEALLSLYTNSIIPNKKLIESLPLIALDTYIKLFIHLNKSSIKFTSKGKSNKMSYEITSSTIPLENLIGFDIFFNIIIVNREEIIVNRTFQFLFISYRNMNKLSTLLNKSILMFNQSHDELPKLFTILTLMIEESEKKGFPLSLKPHNSIRKLGRLTLAIDSLITIDNIFTVTVFQSTTIWELKKIIAQRIHINEDFLEISFMNHNNNKTISQNAHGYSLYEFQLEDYNIIQVNFNSTIDLIPKAFFATPNGDLVPELKIIFNQWYDKYSNIEGKMDRDCCAKFIKQLINTKDTIQLSDSRVETLMSYDKNNEGFIPRNVIIAFFTEASISNSSAKQDIVRENLKHMLYRNDLKPFSEPYNDIIEDKNYYPRWALGQNESFFNQLFSYEFNDEKNVKDMNNIINFMNKLCTNELLYNQIKNFDIKQLMSILMEKSNYPFIKLYYILPIIEQFFENFDNELLSKENNTMNSGESVDNNKHKIWLNHFFDSNGYQFLMNIFDMKTNSNHSIETNVINSLLRIMRIIYDLFLRKISNKKAIEIVDKNQDNDDIAFYEKIEDVIKQHNLIDYLIPLLNKEININAIELLLNTISFSDEIQYKEMLSKINETNIINVVLSCLNQKNNFAPIIIKFIKTNESLKRFDIISQLFNHMFKELNDNLSTNKIFLQEYYNTFGTLYYQYLINKMNMCNSDNSNIKEYDNYIDRIAMIIHDLLSYDDKEVNNYDSIRNDQLIGYFAIISKAMMYSSELQESLSYLIPDLLKQIYLVDADKYLLTIKDDYINPDEFIKKYKTDRICNPSIRKAFFDFITNLIKNSPKNMQNLLSSISQLSSSLSLSASSKEKKLFESSNKPKEEGYIGLRNPGSICYMTSILQQFYMIPTFRYIIMKNDDCQKENYASFNFPDDSIYHQIQKMFSYLNLSLRKDYHPFEFCHSYKDYDGQATNMNAQQDSNEFLSQFIEKMENSLKGTPYKYLTESVFKGSQCTQLKCNICNTSRNRYEDFNYLSLEVKNMKTIYDSLNKLISEETIDGYDCETCHKKVQIKKRNLLSNLPNVLMIYLQRIYYDYETDMNKKINSRLEFPKLLKIKPYTIESTCGEENDEVYTKNDEYYEYHLVGVNVHLGRSEGGHYFSYINASREGEGNSNEMNLNMENWIQFNDDHISKFDIKKLEENCFGGKIQKEESQLLYMKDCIQSAYMLVYERRIKFPLKVIIENIPQDISKKTLINIDSNNAFSIYRQYNIFSHLNSDDKGKSDFTKKLYNDSIFYDKDKKEYFQYVPFYHPQKLIAKKYFIEIFQDNIEFQRNQNISDNYYHSFLHSAISQFVTTIFMTDIITTTTTNTNENEIFDSNVIESFMNFIFDYLSTKERYKSLNLIKGKVSEGLRHTNKKAIESLSKYYIKNLTNVWKCLVHPFSDISLTHCEWLYEITIKLIDNESYEEFIKGEFMNKVLLTIFKFILDLYKKNLGKLGINLIMIYGKIMRYDNNNKLMQFFIDQEYIQYMIKLITSETTNELYDVISAYNLTNIEELMQCLSIILLKTKEHNELNTMIKMLPIDNENSNKPLITLCSKDWSSLRNEHMIRLFYKFTPQHFDQICALFIYKEPYNYLIPISKEIMCSLYTMCNISKFTNMHIILNAISYIIRIEGVDPKIRKIQLETLIGYEQVCIEENNKLYGLPNIGNNVLKIQGKKANMISSLIKQKETFCLYEALSTITNKMVLLDFIEHIIIECSTNKNLYDYIKNIHLDEWSNCTIIEYVKVLMQDMKIILSSSKNTTNHMVDYKKLEEIINQLNQGEQISNKKRYLMNNIHKEEWNLLDKKNNVMLIKINYHVDLFDTSIIKEKEKDIDGNNTTMTINSIYNQPIIDTSVTTIEKESNVLYYSSEQRHSVEKKVIALIENDLSKNKKVVFSSKNNQENNHLCLIRYLVFNMNSKDMNITLNVIPINSKDYINEYIPQGDIIRKVRGNSTKTLLTITKLDPNSDFSFESLEIAKFQSEIAQFKENNNHVFQVIYDSTNRYGSLSHKDGLNRIDSDDDE